MYILNIAAAVFATGMAIMVLKPDCAGWETKLGATLHGLVAFTLLDLALVAIFPIGAVR